MLRRVGDDFEVTGICETGVINLVTDLKILLVDSKHTLFYCFVSQVPIVILSLEL